MEASNKTTFLCLEDENICNICNHPYQQPRLLSCLHSYCHACLERLASFTKQPRAISCPECEQTTHLPSAEGVYGLYLDYVKLRDAALPMTCSACRQAQGTSHCAECTSAFCADCLVSPPPSGGHKAHHSVQPLKSTPAGRSAVCPQHPDAELEYYCVPCEQPVCGKECLRGLHEDHRLESAAKVAERVKHEISTVASAKIKEKIRQFEEGTNNASSILNEWNDLISLLREEKNAIFDFIKDEIQRWNETLENKLITLKETAELPIMDLFNVYQKFIDRLEDASKFSKHLLESGKPIEVLILKNPLYQQLQSLFEYQIKIEKPLKGKVTPFDQEKFKNFIKCIDFELYSPNDKNSFPMKESMSSLYFMGQDTSRNSLSYPLYKENGDALVRCLPGYKNSFSAHSSSRFNEDSLMDGPNIDDTLDYISRENNFIEQQRADVDSLIGGSTFGSIFKDDAYRCQAADKSHRDFYPSEWSGLDIADLRNHLLSSEDNFSVDSFMSAFETMPNNSFSPYLGEAMMSDKHIEKPKPIASKLGSYSSLSLPYPEKSSSELMLHKLNTLSCSSLSSSYNTLQISTPSSQQSFSPNPRSSNANMRQMQIKFKFGQLGSGSGQFNAPHGFCVGLDEDIVVADTNNHRIQVFTSSGDFKFCFGTEGKEDGHLWCPRKVALLPSSGHLVVCDRGCERSRMQLFTYRGRFVRKNAIHYVDIVAGLAVSSTGQIVLVDSVSPTIYFLTASGQLVRRFDCSEYLREPSDLAIRGSELYVCDFKAHCVVVLSEMGHFIRRLGREGLTNFPNGIEALDNGRLLVGDSHGNRFHVAVFSADGEFLFELECPYVKVSRCCGLKMTSSGNCITLAKNNHHVLVLNSSQWM
ncbi:hypothetical protein LAZ67_4001224 [Cordylochernes scorpioides]|uniref:Uncharacterized protein n=1 Tax=Cordylochernes scorpioides TaxID=51811 RepID=A0ABY6KCJ1_9ARAC|nr:hypothetical protein LAZ67_4001224 [Cordylochernes scorpioides]